MNQTRWKFNTLTSISLVIVICLIGLGSFLVFAQEEPEDEEETDCEWKLQNGKGNASISYLSVNALFWNDCTGELYHIDRQDVSDAVTAKKINLP